MKRNSADMRNGLRFRNAAAAAVRTPKFRPRVIANKKREAARRACREK